MSSHPVALPFETLRIGEARIEDSRWDLRLVRRRGEGGAFFIVFAMKASGPFASLDAALAHCTATFPEVTWRGGLQLDAGGRPCPICAAPDARGPRYPRAICPACVLEAVDAEGSPVSFYNVSMSGGFEARHGDGRRDQDRVCYVRGIRCRGDEARFGGIVIERTDERSSDTADR